MIAKWRLEWRRIAFFWLMTRPTFLEALAERLNIRGLEVTCASSGREALRLIEDQTFDAVLLDLSMPGLDGLETLRRLRESHPNLQVMILSGRATVQTAVEATRLGAIDIFEKPTDVETLVERIRSVVRRVWRTKKKSRSITSTTSCTRKVGRRRPRLPSPSRVVEDPVSRRCRQGQRHHLDQRAGCFVRVLVCLGVRRSRWPLPGSGRCTLRRWFRGTPVCLRTSMTSSRSRLTHTRRPRFRRRSKTSIRPAAAFFIDPFEGVAGDDEAAKPGELSTTLSIPRPKWESVE